MLFIMEGMGFAPCPPFLIMNNASKIIGSAIIGVDSVTVSVAGKIYIITAPTIHRIAGVAVYLSYIGDGQNMKEVLNGINNAENAAKALSWFICGNTSKYRELSKGTFDEIVNGLEKAYSLISAKNFMKLSALAKSVALLTAKPKL